MCCISEILTTIKGYSPARITLVENEWEVEAHRSEELFRSQRRCKAFAPLLSSAKQSNTKEQLSWKSFCFMSTHKRCNAMQLKWFCQESDLHKIMIWKPLETSKTCSNNNSNMQTDGPTTGLGQRTLLVPSNEERKYPQGELYGFSSWHGFLWWLTVRIAIKPNEWKCKGVPCHP